MVVENKNRTVLIFQQAKISSLLSLYFSTTYTSLYTYICSFTNKISQM